LPAKGRNESAAEWECGEWNLDKRTESMRAGGNNDQ
jgi:hypothetical protein